MLARRCMRPGRRATAIDRCAVEFDSCALLDAWSARCRHPSGLDERPDRVRGHDPGLRIVLAIREDFLAQLTPCSHAAGGLRTRFRLERLDRASALAAVKNPLAGTDRSFAPGAAEALVDDLLRLRVDTGRGESEEVKGEYVEPVQLQVACMTLWADLPPDVSEITTQQLSAYADVDQVLARFYDDAVATAAGTSRRRERHVRAWVEETLITPGGTRAAAYAAANDTAGMPSEIVRTLEEKRLIRAEWRAGARWYELTHDRLIGPIRRSNGAFRAAMVKRRIRRLILVVAIASVVAAAAIVLGIGRSNGKEASRCTDCQARFPACRAAKCELRDVLEADRERGCRRWTFHFAPKRRCRQVRSRHDRPGDIPSVLDATCSKREHCQRSADLSLALAAEPASNCDPMGPTTEAIRSLLHSNSSLRSRVAPGDAPLDIATTRPFPVKGQPPGSSRIQVTFTVVLLGTGSGVVEGPGIDCGAICSSQFAFGRTITLTAVPDRTQRSQAGITLPRSEFFGLHARRRRDDISRGELRRSRRRSTSEPDGSGSGRITRNPGGISCGDGCWSYGAPTTVILKAVADPGSVFDGWQGACAGTRATIARSRSAAPDREREVWRLRLHLWVRTQKHRERSRRSLKRQTNLDM